VAPDWVQKRNTGWGVLARFCANAILCRGRVAFLGAAVDCISLRVAKSPRNFRKMSKNATQYATDKWGCATENFAFAEKNEGCRPKNATLENEGSCIRFLILVTRNGCVANINSIIRPVVKSGIEKKQTEDTASI
jgi:hypothetical protein